MKKFLFIMLFSFMLIGCGASAAVAPTSIAANPTAIPQATPQSTSQTIGILYVEYDLFELEGVPPMTSDFVPIQRRNQTWIDSTDPNRSRQERHFVTQETPAREGLEAVYRSSNQQHINL